MSLLSGSKRGILTRAVFPEPRGVFSSIASSGFFAFFAIRFNPFASLRQPFTDLWDYFSTVYPPRSQRLAALSFFRRPSAVFIKADLLPG
jgi:hypothetical protein